MMIARHALALVGVKVRPIEQRQARLVGLGPVGCNSGVFPRAEPPYFVTARCNN